MTHVLLSRAISVTYETAALGQPLLDPALSWLSAWYSLYTSDITGTINCARPSPSNFTLNWSTVAQFHCTSSFE